MLRVLYFSCPFTENLWKISFVCLRSVLEKLMKNIGETGDMYSVQKVNGSQDCES